MRFLNVIAALVMLTAPITLHAETQPTTHHTFTGANCRAKVPCTDSFESLDLESLSKVAETCLSQDVGMQVDEPFFSSPLPLTKNDCLLPNQAHIGKATEKTLLPQCCIVPLRDGRCIMRCELVDGWK